MPKNLTSRDTTADKIAALIRIFRAAAIARDEPLRLSAAVELAKFGIRSGDLVASSLEVANER
jgi:hypothetical protein